MTAGFYGSVQNCENSIALAVVQKSCIDLEDIFFICLHLDHDSKSQYDFAYNDFYYIQQIAGSWNISSNILYVIWMV